MHESVSCVHRISLWTFGEIRSTQGAHRNPVFVGYSLDTATVAPNPRYGVNWVGSLTPSLKHSWF